jgi:hypothetical protein
MPKVSWSFNSYTWPVNPYSDSGWVTEVTYAELQPLAGNRSLLHYVGTKAARRTISGFIVGPKAQEFYDHFQTALQSRVTGILVDHLGQSRTCRLVSFKPEVVYDRISHLNGRPAYKYTAEFVEV